MSLKFGTSGVRGLVTELTDNEVFLFTRAFIQYMKSKCVFLKISVAGDLRVSTPRLIKAVNFAIIKSGLEMDYCGYISSPALMFHGMNSNIPSIMVTGSHIPDDRNGLKFNTPWG